jgi:hypothetical protein
VHLSTGDGGLKWVGVEELYADTSSGAQQSAGFFSATLCLFSAMCTGRNYVCMKEIGGLFPRDALYNVRRRALAPVKRRPACI